MTIARMLPEDTIEPRVTTGVHARALAPPAPAPAEAPDPIAEGLARALRHMTAANTTATLLLDDLAEVRELATRDPALAEAYARVEGLARRVRREVAFALQDITAGPPAR